jgi:hypothetical protein
LEELLAPLAFVFDKPHQRPAPRTVPFVTQLLESSVLQCAVAGRHCAVSHLR